MSSALGCAAPSAPNESAVEFSQQAHVGGAVVGGAAGTVASNTAGIGGGVAGSVGGEAGFQGSAGNGEAAGSGAAGVDANAGTGAMAGTGAAGVSGGDAGTGAAGAAGSGSAGTGAAGTGAVGGVTSMQLSFTTASQGGKYAPRNIGAAWIATSGGQWVKTLEVWAKTRAQYLSKFNVTGGNKVDAVTSSTLSAHKTHMLTWNLKDASGAAAAPGDYQVIIESTDHNGAGKWIAASFTLGDAPMSVTPAGDAYFKSISIQLQ